MSAFQDRRAPLVQVSLERESGRRPFSCGLRLHYQYGTR
jgi:hypothetical protein